MVINYEERKNLWLVRVGSRVNFNTTQQTNHWYRCDCLFVLTTVRKERFTDLIFWKYHCVIRRIVWTCEIVHLVNEFPVLYGTKMSMSFFREPANSIHPQPTNLIHSLLYQFSKSFLIISPKYMQFCKRI
jgi:hypothetical protein